MNVAAGCGCGGTDGGGRLGGGTLGGGRLRVGKLAEGACDDSLGREAIELVEATTVVSKERCEIWLVGREDPAAVPAGRRATTTGVVLLMSLKSLATLVVVL